MDGVATLGSALGSRAAVEVGSGLAGADDSGAVGVTLLGSRGRRTGSSASGFVATRSGGGAGRSGSGRAAAAEAGGPAAGSSSSCALKAGGFGRSCGASESMRTSPSSASSASSAPAGSDHGSRLQGASSRRTESATALLVLHRDQEMLGSGLARLEHRLDHQTVWCGAVGRHHDAGLGAAQKRS